MRIFAFAIFVLSLGVAAAYADSTRVIETRDGFSKLVEGKTLSALGVNLQVLPDGGITGRAFGRDVTGSWQWSNGYFCRSLTFGKEALPDDCQQVVTEGNRITFIADKGTGQSAKLRIR